MPSARVVHLPYQIPADANRFFHYENLWKRVALNLLVQKEGTVRGLSLLDYGCGRGETMELAKAMGMKVKGLDLDPECVRISGQFGPTELIDLSQWERQLPRKSYDVVACFHVLEHVDNPKAVLTWLGQVARKYVLVAVPNLAHFPNLRRPWQPPLKVNPGHLQSWDHSHFKNLCEIHCGLRVLAWGFDATIIPPLSELIRRIFGEKAVVFLETKIFRRLYPYLGISVIALLEPLAQEHHPG